MQNLNSLQVMGVLNVTPDSFSDAGRFSDGNTINLPSVIDAAAAMVGEGTNWLDVGGESTRPGAESVSLHIELDRVIPVVEALTSRFDIPVSVDTSSAEVITESANAGAHMINDVRALKREGALDAFIDTGLSLCLMHMQGQPESMQDKPEYDSVVKEVGDFLASRIGAVVDHGIDRQRICVDPGIGFGKSVQHNLQLINGIAEIKKLGCAVMIGVSRKSVIGHLTGRVISDRLTGTIALNMLALQAGASILRVHDVAAAVDTIKVWQAYQAELLV